MNNNFDIQQYRTLIKDYSQRTVAEMIGVPRSTIQDKLVKMELDYWGNEKIELPIIEGRKPKVLLIDLETSATLAYIWKRWQENISSKQVVKEGGYILTASWKWLDGDTTWVEPASNPVVGDDYELCQKLHSVVEEADVIIGHNLNGFDYKVLNARLVINGLKPLKPVKRIDTLAIARREFRFNSNRLDDLGSYLNVGNKVDTGGFELWARVMSGSKIALQDMMTYNRQDVLLLEQVYLKLRAYDTKPTFNAAHYYNDNLLRCPTCGSSNIEASGNSSFTPVSSFEEVVCNSCGSRSRKRQATNTKEKRSTMLIK